MAELKHTCENNDALADVGHAPEPCLACDWHLARRSLACGNFSAGEALDRLGIHLARLKQENAELWRAVDGAPVDGEVSLPSPTNIETEALAAATQPVKAPEVDGCPCHYTRPCHPLCSCVDPLQSRGCERCAKYGSLEQRRAAAETIADAVQAAHYAVIGAQPVKAPGRIANEAKLELVALLEERLHGYFKRNPGTAWTQVIPATLREVRAALETALASPEAQPEQDERQWIDAELANISKTEEGRR